MDAVAVAASFAGLASLGISVCNGILRYYDSWKDAEDNMRSMYKSVESLTKTFLVLKRSLESFSGKALSNSDTVSRVRESICDCEDGISKLEAKLLKINLAKSSKINQKDKSRSDRAKAQLRRAQYPFKEGTLVRLKEICSGLQDDLLLTMETLHM